MHNKAMGFPRIFLTHSWVDRALLWFTNFQALQFEKTAKKRDSFPKEGRDCLNGEKGGRVAVVWVPEENDIIFILKKAFPRGLEAKTSEN